MWECVNIHTAVEDSRESRGITAALVENDPTVRSSCGSELLRPLGGSVT